MTSYHTPPRTVRSEFSSALMRVSHSGHLLHVSITTRTSLP